jgi:hypothetical protein
MDRDKIKQKLSEIINNSDFSNVLQEQGISAQDIVIEVKLNSPQSRQPRTILAGMLNLPGLRIIKNREDMMIASLQRVCPCNPGDPINKCCFK